MIGCPFCNINKKKTRVIKEGKYVFALLSNPRLMRGHILVSPKRHVQKFSELDEKEKKELFKFAINFQEKILTKLASGCDMRQNFRPFQKLSDLKVHHLHIHLQPREFKDELYRKCQIYETDIFKKINEKEMREMTKLFRD